MSALITPAALAATLASVKILDCSYGVPDAHGAFARAHIPGAQFFDIDEVADPQSPYAHTLPSADLFGQMVGAMGIGNDDAVVVYDQNGISFAAARVWWMFRTMGHQNVKVLNGGLPAWLRAGQPVESGAAPALPAKTFAATLNENLLRRFEDMDASRETVIDARGAERFSAAVRSADGDMVPAHIPGSQNVPFAMLLDPHGALKDADACAALLFPRIEAGSTLAVTCGSGVTACVLALGFYEAGFPDVAVYDGSWTEWSDKNALR